MQRYTYVANLFFVFVLPAIELTMLARIELPFVQLALFLFVVLFMGSLWDIWATRHGSNDTTWIWRFSEKHVLGPRIFDVPIEEYLFYPISTVFLITLWEGIAHGYASGDVGMLFLLLVIATQTAATMVVFMLLSAGRKRRSHT